MLRFAIVALLISFGLAACGETRLERGAAGGAAGALTDEEDIDLGEPIWDRDNDDDND